MLPFTQKRLPVNTNSTYALSVFKSHLKNILYDVQSKNKTTEKKTQKQGNFRDRKITAQQTEHRNV